MLLALLSKVALIIHDIRTLMGKNVNEFFAKNANPLLFPEEIIKRHLGLDIMPIGVAKDSVDRYHRQMNRI